MRISQLILFDDYVVGATHAAPVFTADVYNGLLGAFDQLVIHAVVGNITGTGGTFDALVEHSCDGKRWIQKSSATGSPPPGEVHMVGLGTNTNSDWGWTKGAYFLTYARLRLYFSGTTTGGKVTLYATQRDKRT